MPVNKFHEAKLTFVLSAAQTPQIRRAMRSPGPVCLCHTPATSTSCRSKFHTWPFLERQLLLWCCVVTGVHASTRKQWALQCPSSSALPTGHSVGLRYCVVGHVAFLFGFCPLTNRYICLCNPLQHTWEVRVVMGTAQINTARGFPKDVKVG